MKHMSFPFYVIWWLVNPNRLLRITPYSSPICRWWRPLYKQTRNYKKINLHIVIYQQCLICRIPDYQRNTSAQWITNKFRIDLLCDNTNLSIFTFHINSILWQNRNSIMKFNSEWRTFFQNLNKFRHFNFKQRKLIFFVTISHHFNVART